MATERVKTPDGQWVLYKRVDQVASDIMVVENFR